MRCIFKAQEYIAHEIFCIILGVNTRNYQVLLNFPIQILNKEKNRGLAAEPWNGAMSRWNTVMHKQKSKTLLDISGNLV